MSPAMQLGDECSKPCFFHTGSPRQFRAATSKETELDVCAQVHVAFSSSHCVVYNNMQ